MSSCAAPPDGLAPVGSAAGRWGVVLAVDVAAVVGFALVGRLAHGGEGGLVSGTLAVAAPFVLGLLAGWLRAPCAGIATADRARTTRFGWWVLAWTLGGGLLLRWLTGEGLAPAFVLVAAVVLTGLLVGRRAVRLA